jgi:hypothetical protein
MTRQEAKQNLMNEFISNFNETTPVVFDNQNIFWYCTNPLTATVKPSDNSWVSFNIAFNKSYQRTIGKKPYRRWCRPGIIHANVNIREGIGTTDGDTLCEEIIDIFEGERIDEIVCYDGFYEPIGNVDGFYLYNIIIYFKFNETK